MKSFLLVSFLSGLCFANNIKAEETRPQSDIWIVSTVRSYHFNRTKQHNEDNKGIGVEWHLTSYLYGILGEYDNSYNVHSTYFGAMFMPFEYKGFRAGAMGIFLNGYKENPSSYLFGGAPMFSYQYKDFGVNVMTLFPPRLHPRSGVAGLQLKYQVPLSLF